jgi:pimeloyl-ACP methyl ester carboxylesterase
VPVLVLNGEHDSMAKIDAAAVSLFRDAKLELVPDWGGQLQGSAPKLYADHLLDFLLPKFSR